jgi:serine/threonine-protein kinase mTOR
MTDCVPYLPLLIPPILNLIKTCDITLKESLFHHLSDLVRIVGENISKFCPMIFGVIYEFILMPKYQMRILELIEILSKYVRDFFKNELSTILPKLLFIIHENQYKNKDTCMKGLKTLKEIGNLLDEYLHLIIPAMLSICCSTETSIDYEVKLAALSAIKSVVRCEHFKEFTANLVHPLTKQLETVNYHNYGVKIISLFQYILQNLNQHFAMFIPIILKTMSKNKLSHAEFETTVNRLLQMSRVDLFFKQLEPSKEEHQVRGSVNGSIAQRESINPKTGRGLNPSQLKTRQQKIDLSSLLKEFDATKCTIKADWIEWLKKTSVELLRQVSFSSF